MAIARVIKVLPRLDLVGNEYSKLLIGFSEFRERTEKHTRRDLEEAIMEAAEYDFAHAKIAKTLRQLADRLDAEADPTADDS